MENVQDNIRCQWASSSHLRAYNGSALTVSRAVLQLGFCQARPNAGVARWAKAVSAQSRQRGVGHARQVKRPFNQKMNC
jgi:hypothetical protein